ncbi:ERG2 family protein [Paraliomyxa miuraensis]|uniref:ERG2 family protein n=1 Tax=Paraliomyxa miuraensis TaxID=376150 RepID=UPI002255C08C|nr:ERG2 family protein [Paraliomyxa miuraensis]MCX4242050.1 ERG2 family protein [Paraliomyxa miuraensis]
MGYIFDVDVLHRTATDALGQPIDRMIEQIAADLHEIYPGHIDRNPPWVLNNAGGAMGAFALLHASITEYLIVFGTPIGTEGHSGRHLATDYFIILEGEQWAFTPGSTAREVYKPGDMHVLPAGSVQGYRIPESGWALEYARGFIPSMMPFGLADVLSSTLDFPSFGKTLGIYTKAVVGQLLKGKI